MGWVKQGPSLAAFWKGGEAGHSLSHFPQQEKSQAEISLGLKSFHRGWEVMRLNYSSSMRLNIFLLQWCAETFLLLTFTYTQPPLSMGYCQRFRVSQGFEDCSWEGLKLVHGPLLGPSQHLGLFITQLMDGQDPSWVCCVCCWILKLPQKHFCLWMVAKLLGGWGRDTNEDALFSHVVDITFWSWVVFCKDNWMAGKKWNIHSSQWSNFCSLCFVPSKCNFFQLWRL